MTYSVKNVKTITRNYPTYEAAFEAGEDFAMYAKVEGPLKNDVDIEETSFAQYKLIITIEE